MNTPTNNALLEQALPADVSVQSDTWLTRYRNYPVFSRTWFKHRTLAFGFATILLMVLITIIGIFVNNGNKYYIIFAVIPFLVGGISLLVLGQSIAVWVRSQRYAPKKEAILITLAIIFGAAGSCGITYGMINGAGVLLPNEAKIYKENARKDKEKKETELTTQVEKTKKDNASTQDISKIKDNNDNTATTIKFIIGFAPLIFIVLYQGSFFDVYLYIRQRKRLAESLREQELKQAQEARREAELRLSVLVAQVEPHFLFNTLAGVRSAILTEPLRATVIVDHLVDYLRATIPSMRDDGTSNQGRLAQQLESAKSYLGLMQARIPRLSFDVSTDIKDAALPPLILISLVENAIKHGIEPKVGPVHISVNATISEQGDDEFLEIAVCDNGVGFGGTTSGSGIGLANIRERLESTYGNAASLTLKARTEGGVEARIVLPLSV